MVVLTVTGRIVYSGKMKWLKTKKTRTKKWTRQLTSTDTVFFFILIYWSFCSVWWIIDKSNYYCALCIIIIGFNRNSVSHFNYLLIILILIYHGRYDLYKPRQAKQTGIRYFAVLYKWKCIDMLYISFNLVTGYSWFYIIYRYSIW